MNDSKEAVEEMIRTISADRLLPVKRLFSTDVVEEIYGLEKGSVLRDVIEHKVIAEKVGGIWIIDAEQMWEKYGIPNLKHFYYTDLWGGVDFARSRSELDTIWQQYMARQWSDKRVSNYDFRQHWTFISFAEIAAGINRTDISGEDVRSMIRSWLLDDDIYVPPDIRLFVQSELDKY